MTENQQILLLFGLIVVAAIVVLVYGLNVSPGDDDDRIGVIVTIPPQAEFVERVGGDHVSVTIMVPAGADPHTYAPTPSQMVAVGQAALYFSVGSGVEFETVHLATLTGHSEQLVIVDGSQGIALREIDDGGDDDEHGHGLQDPHIWLSPRNAEQMVITFRDALIAHDPDHEDAYQENAAAYLAELRDLDAAAEAMRANVSKQAFLTYHPAWGYLADAYNLTQIPIENRGNEPTLQDLVEIIDEVREYGITTVFVSPQFSRESAAVIADEIGGAVVAIDPLAHAYSDELYSVIEKMGEALA